MIEYVQKQVLFEQAAKQGIMGSQLLQVPEILQNLVGISDIGMQQWGSPLTPIYTAQSGQLIQIPKIANYFSGLSTDISVADVSLTNLEDELTMFNLEMYSRMQLVNNLSQQLSTMASQEALRASTGAVWAYTETFANTDLIDMINTTAWIDSAEGIAFIPDSGDQNTVPMQDITVSTSSLPTQGNFLGSDPSLAVNGLGTTNWICLFVQADNSMASATYSLSSPSDLTAISVNPVGFGINLLIECDSGNGFVTVVNAITYSLTTYPISQLQVTSVRVSYNVATSVLPKTVGISEIILYQSASLLTCDLYSQVLSPNNPFTEVKLSVAGTFPTGTTVTPYFRTDPSLPWTLSPNNSWQPISATDTTALTVNFTNAVGSTSETSYSGLYAIGLGINATPLTNQEGSMQVGVNMVEVSCFKYDWLQDGIWPRILNLNDFTSNITKRTWSIVGSESFPDSEQGSGTCLQFSNQNSISGNRDLISGGDYMVFQRLLDSNYYSSDIATYQQLCIVPLCGVANEGMMQYGYNYKISFQVYCPISFSYSDARYWLYQGYREAGAQLYSDLGKSYGTFSMYINGIVVAGKDVGSTISTDDLINGVDPLVTPIDGGTSFAMNFNSGWNQVDILVNAYDPNNYGPDGFDLNTYAPYLQLSIYPSPFDPTFQQSASYPITQLLASGIFNPVDEFDLVWNLPKEPTFWSWSDDGTNLYFNTNTLKLIDGVYKGSSPTSIINYQSIQSNTIEDLYVRINLARADNTPVSPILSNYNIMVS